MISFRAHPGVGHLALSLFAALGGLYILVYGSWKAVATDSTVGVLVALLGAMVAVRNVIQLVAGRAVVTVSGDGVEIKGWLSRRPVRRALDDCSAMRSTSFLLMPAVEFARDPSLDDNRPSPVDAPTAPRIRLLRVGFDFRAIADAIDSFRSGARSA